MFKMLRYERKNNILRYTVDEHVPEKPSQNETSLTVFVGTQAEFKKNAKIVGVSQKSLAALLIYFFNRLPRHIQESFGNQDYDAIEAISKHWLSQQASPDAFFDDAARSAKQAVERLIVVAEVIKKQNDELTSR
jgi:hypothetical protein